MTINPFEINNINKNVELNQNQLHNQTSTVLFDCAYGSPQNVNQVGPKLKHFFEVTRELADIGHGHFTEKDAGDIQHLYEGASKQHGATRETVTRALQERATELNEKLQKQHINARVEVVSGKGNGYDDGYYAFKVEQFDNKTGGTNVVGYLKIGNPKNPGQPIEEKTS